MKGELLVAGELRVQRFEKYIGTFFFRLSYYRL